MFQNNVKIIIKKLVQHVNNMHHRHMFGADMKDKIKKSEVPILALSDEEKKEIMEYWKGKYEFNPDFNTFKWYYSVNGQKDPRYISEDIYTNYIWTSLNEMKRCKGLCDKNLLDILYSGERMPDTVFHNINGVFLDKEYQIISRTDAIDLAKKYEKIVIKPAIDSCQGDNIVCINGSDCEEYLDSFNRDFIVQKVVTQHSSFNMLNESSVNVVRMTSLLLNDEVHILDSIIRVGAPGNFTDHKNIAIGIDESGKLKEYGVTVKGAKVNKLPNGLEFHGLELAGYQEMRRLVKRLHQRTPQARLIGWDLTADEKGHALIIEANMDFPGIGRGQDCNGPFLGKYTDDVMEYVIQKKRG